jgi:hypothetical protein
MAAVEPLHTPPAPPGHGWWLTSDGTWHPPDTAPPEGWWLDADDVWRPPEDPPGFGPSHVSVLARTRHQHAVVRRLRHLSHARPGREITPT